MLKRFGQRFAALVLVTLFSSAVLAGETRQSQWGVSTLPPGPAPAATQAGPTARPLKAPPAFAPADSARYHAATGRDLQDDLHHSNWFYRKQATLSLDPAHDPWHPRYARSQGYDHSYDREQRLRHLAADETTDPRLRQKMQQEISRVDQLRDSGRKTGMRSPKGYDLAHQRGREKAKGYGYNYAVLQLHELHMLQHTGKLDGSWEKDRNTSGGDQWGRRNRERVPDSYRNQGTAYH